MKSIILFVVFYFSVGCLIGQLKIQGKVVDSSGQPIEAASISVSFFNEESALSFTRTNEMGKYFLVMTDSFKSKALLIRVNAFGFFTATAPLRHPSDSVNFVLKPNSIELPPVEVKDKEIKIRKVGDTLNFSAKSFSNSSDKVIGDIIKKLPGIEMDLNGTIFYNGVPINNFYIDGDNLLDDRYTIASRSLPVDLVDKIQVIENNQHIKALAGIVQTDRAAINIKLKEKAKLNWTNDLALGAGMENVYSGELTTLAFKSRLKAINVLKANNTGNDLTDEANSNASMGTAGFNEPEQQVDVLTTDKIDNIGFGKQRYLFNDPKMISVNTMYKFYGGASARINGYILEDAQNQTSDHSSTIVIPGNTIQYHVSNKIEDRLVKGRVGLTLNTNTKKLYFNNTLSYENGNLTTDAATLSDTLYTKQHLTSGRLIFRNSANGVFVIKKKQIIEFTSDFFFSRKPENLIVSPGLFLDLVNAGQPYNRFDQKVSTPSLYITNSLSHRRTFGSFLQTSSFGISYNKQTLNSALQLNQLNGQVLNAPDSFYNSFELNKWKLILENEIRWQKNNTLVRFGMPIQKVFLSTFDSVLLPKPERISLLLFQPTIQFRQMLGKEGDLNIKYNYSRNYANITDIYKGKILQDYRDITYNDIAYPESVKNQHSVAISYSFRNSIKIFFFNISAMYQQNKSDFLLSSFVTTNLTKSIAIPAENTSALWAVNTSMSKYIFPFKTTIHIKYSFRLREAPVFQNGLLFNNANTSGNYFFGLDTKVTKWLFTKYEAAYFLVNTQNSSADTKNSAAQLRQTVSTDIIPGNSFSLRLGAEQYLLLQNDNIKRSFYFMDASIKYKFSKPRIDCELSCLNITDLNQYIINQVYSNSISNSSVSIRPRTVLCKVSFSF